jgi:hypothetical protein
VSKTALSNLKPANPSGFGAISVAQTAAEKTHCVLPHTGAQRMNPPTVFNPQDLGQFTGTTGYYRITRKHLLTDGTKYLADAAGAYWLMDAATSHLDEIGSADLFVLIKLQVQQSRAVMVYEDGNGNEHARQEIAYTDFPLAGIELYACWDGEHWVIMLPSEY